MLRKTLTAVGLSVGLAFSAGALAEGAVLVGVVDMMKVLQNSTQFQDLQVELKAKVGEKEQKLTEDYKNFQEKVEKFNKSSVVMRAKDKEKEERALVDEREGLEARRMELQKEYEDVNRNKFPEVQKDLDRSVRVVAEGHKLDLVVSMHSVHYYNKNRNLDITDEVAKKMAEFAKVASNKGSEKGESKAVMQKAAE